MARWTVALPVWVWILILVTVYILIKSPADGFYVISLPAHLISGIGKFVIRLDHRFGAT